MFERLIVERLEDFAVRRHAFLNSKSQFTRNQRRWLDRVKVVKLWARLPADFDYIFEAFGGNQCDTGSLTLQQRIRPDRGAMNNFKVEQLRASFRRDLFQSFGNRSGGIVRRGSDFEDAKFVIHLIDEVSKRAARVDADAYRVHFFLTMVAHE